MINDVMSWQGVALVIGVSIFILTPRWPSPHKKRGENGHQVRSTERDVDNEGVGSSRESGNEIL